jgi:small GTP-binding protein
MEELDYNVVVVGEVSSGKSSFINSLLGTYLCPTSILRKTLVKTNNKMISHNDKTGKDEIINLIDYPGFNDAAQNTFLREFLEEISKYDHVIWITTAEKCLMNESEKKILYSICDQINLTSKLIMVSVVVNKSDMNDSNQNVFRFEKNEYEILYDNMKNNLEKDYPFVKIFKHSSYYAFLDKIKSSVFNLEPTYVDEFNRTVRTKHGPQSSNFRANDMIDYSSLLESGVLPSTNIVIPNTIEPYLFEIARSNRLESFKRALGSKRQTIGEDLELIYDVMVQISSKLKFNPVNSIKATELRIAHTTKSTLEKIKNRMTEINLVAKNKTRLC